jgi:predicted  nucleic acid-binding Zn-ribbon protein
MYAVVGCSNCGARWIVEGRPETTSCPRCGTRHQFDRLKAFGRTEDLAAAREIRASLLAADQDREAAFESIDSVPEMEEQAATGVVTDEEYLAGKGVDPDAVAAADEPNDSGPSGRREQVLAIIDSLEEPTASTVVEHAADQGIDPDWVREALGKFERQGTIVQGPSGYRRL